MGWDYALSWLTILPFELTAASITIKFWRDDINVGVWITVFLVVLCVIQVFGVRGYGEVEFVLSMIKILACTGFIILGIIINCGGVGDRGYIGAKYWHDPGAFRNGFKGFCGVFVVAAFAFGGTELVGLAAAESADPAKSIPKATKQVFWRIAFFYVVNLFIVGLILPSNDERLLGASGANTKASPFVLAIEDAGIKVLPSIFNAVITISVISVANSCTFGSTRTMQALAERGMAPKILAYVDKNGRPIWCIVIQILFGFIAFVGESGSSDTVFDWLLALSGLSYFFVWGSICLTHIRFRYVWSAKGKTLDQIPYKPTLGIIGSYIGLFLNVICMIATFYHALWVRRLRPFFFFFFSFFFSLCRWSEFLLTYSFCSHIQVSHRRPLSSSRSTSHSRLCWLSTFSGRCTAGTGSCTCAPRTLTSTRAFASMCRASTSRSTARRAASRCASSTVCFSLPTAGRLLCSLSHAAFLHLHRKYERSAVAQRPSAIFG